MRVERVDDAAIIVFDVDAPDGVIERRRVDELIDAVGLNRRARDECKMQNAKCKIDDTSLHFAFCLLHSRTTRHAKLHSSNDGP